MSARLSINLPGSNDVLHWCDTRSAAAGLQDCNLTGLRLIFVDGGIWHMMPDNLL